MDSKAVHHLLPRFLNEAITVDGQGGVVTLKLATSLDRLRFEGSFNV